MGLMRLAKVLAIARHPVETIIWLYSLGLFSYAVYVLSPLYQTSYASVLSNFDTRTQEAAVGVVFILTTVLGLVFPFIKETNKTKILKLSAFMLFLDFFFLAVFRIMSVGFVPVHWLPLLLLSLSCGVSRLFLEVRKD